MRLLKMCPGSECVLACSAKLDGWWGSFWKCVQYVSVFWHLLTSWMPNEAPSENVSREWVCSGIFWQAGWLIRLLLKMCPESEYVLASSDKLNYWGGPFWKCVQGVSVFWHLLASWLMSLFLKMCPESECVLASSDKLDDWWGFFWKCV